jgi:hypothetical protein
MQAFVFAGVRMRASVRRPDVVACHMRSNRRIDRFALFATARVGTGATSCRTSAPQKKEAGREPGL